MDGIYEVSSTERVKGVDREFASELKDLQNEIEEGNFLSDNDVPDSFSSFYSPRESKYFTNQRKLMLKDYLQVREAKQLKSQAGMMEEEIKSCLKYEYNINSIPLILHQFYLKRVKDLLLLMHLHMLRWTRFCQHTTVIDGLYPEYSKRLNNILLEYQDSLERATRMSSIHEAYLTNSAIPYDVIKNEDLDIYTKWLVTHFHSTKKIHAFLQYIQWIPHKYLQLDAIYQEIDYRGVKTKEETILSSHSFDKPVTDELKSKSSSFISSSCKFVTPKEKVNFAAVRTLVNWKQKAAFSRERGMLRKHRPLLSCNVSYFATTLEFLLLNYDIGMSCQNLGGSSDQMDIFNLVFEKFKKEHYRQEQERLFPVYGLSDEKETSQESTSNPVMYKKESNWLPFIQIKPDLDGTQIAALTKLKQQNHIDELLYIQSRIFYVDSAKKILNLMKDFAKHIKNQTKIQPTNVTTFQRGKKTKEVWKKLFSTTNTSSSKMDALDFDSRLKEDDINSVSNKNMKFEGDYSDEKHAVANNGALLSLMLLRHLKIKDYRHNCLCTLNYFRSIERSLTIDDAGLSVSNEDVMTPPKKHLASDSDFDIGSSNYLYNTPVDHVIHANDHKESKVENHDDFYHFRENNIYVQDEQGQFIIYDSAFEDFMDLEKELLLIGSHFLGCDSNNGTSIKTFTNDFSLSEYSSQHVDRFGVLLDLWGNESSYLESKRILVDCFMEIYQHVICVKERKKLAQIITSFIYQRPRIDFSEEYFVTSYNSEKKLLNVYFQLVKSIVDEHIEDQRAFIKRLKRNETKEFGIPPKNVEIQNIAVSHNQPALKNIFLLEFHPSLGIISSVIDVLKNAYQKMLHQYPPKNTLEQIKLEVYLFEISFEKWLSKRSLMEGFTEKIEKDLLNEVFIENPLFVSEVGNSLKPPQKSAHSLSSNNDEVQKMIGVWSSLLEVITFRNRLLQVLYESRVIIDIYQENALVLGFDTSHAYIRPNSFERILANKDLDLKPFSTNKVSLDESKVDKFSPVLEYLAMSDLDEKHFSLFAFRNRDGLIKCMQKDSIEILRLNLLVQVCHKNLFVSSLQQINNCRSVLRTSSIASFISKAPNPASKKAMTKQALNKLTKAFVSVQGEKSFYRDNMLHEFLKIVKKRGLQRSEEIFKLKFEVIQNYCLSMHQGVSQYALRAQIIAYNHSLIQLLNSFPLIRDSHFMIGEENETKANVADELVQEPDILKKRPRKFLSEDGSQLINLWFIPHFNEILVIFQDFETTKCTELLKLILKLVSSLHDICQYLSALARSGSSHSRKQGDASKEYPTDTADWGGVEGIGSALREIQKQINMLNEPTNPQIVSQFLANKRDVMFLEFDITINYSVPNGFLSSSKIDAFKSITSWSSFQKLGNLSKPLFYDNNIDLPGPLTINDSRTVEYFPWRRFLSLYGYHTSCYAQFSNISSYMQLPLIGLNDVNKRIVHGELLGVGLLLEEVVFAGQPNISPPETKSSTTTKDEKSKDVVIGSEKILKKVFNPMCPLEAIEFVRMFLKRWSQLEKIKRIWACQRLHVTQINSTKLFKSFIHLFNSEVMEPIYKKFASADDLLLAFDSRSSKSNNTTNGKVVHHKPTNVTEYELKIYQMCRLLENIEIIMLQDCIKKVSRENTQVAAEKARADQMLPTDLWKNANMKENVSMQKPYLVEKFLDDLQITGSSCSEDVVTFDRDHFDKCLMKLANACFIREKSCFLNYSTFYENLLRHQNQLLYTKEKELRQLSEFNSSSKISTDVEIDCRLADKSFDLIIEVTALRAKVKDLQNLMVQKEVAIKQKIQNLYEDLVNDLFDNSFNMVNKFDKFQLNIYNDVIGELSDVRRKAVEKMKMVQKKYGAKMDDSESIRLINAERLRELQTENGYYVAMLRKLKNIHQWKGVKEKSQVKKQLQAMEEKLLTIKDEKEHTASLNEEKDKLIKEEKGELSRLLVSLEKECENLRKQLEKEQKLQAQRAHTQLQEQKSLTHIRTAKASNWEKLESGLVEREKELKQLKDTSLKDREQSARSVSEMRRLLKQSAQHVQDERKLKLEAYSRVDELQKQIVDLEEQMNNMVKDKSNAAHETCFPLVPGGSTLPNRPKSRTQQLARPKSSIPFTASRPISGKPVSVARPATSLLKAKSAMIISGSNWTPYAYTHKDSNT